MELHTIGGKLVSRNSNTARWYTDHELISMIGAKWIKDYESRTGPNIHWMLRFSQEDLKVILGEETLDTLLNFKHWNSRNRNTKYVNRAEKWFNKMGYQVTVHASERCAPFVTKYLIEGEMPTNKNYAQLKANT